MFAYCCVICVIIRKHSERSTATQKIVNPIEKSIL
nr:MAG TPA: hypothetical protein [Caudoviricetes sp.]